MRLALLGASAAGLAAALLAGPGDPGPVTPAAPAAVPARPGLKRRRPCRAAGRLRGGYKEVATPARPTGFFRVEKAGDRWTFITPEGHPFWLRAVYGIDITDGGSAYVDALKVKYAADYIPWWTYVQQAGKRMRGWGFNAFGEYSSPYAFPIPTYGRRETNAEKLPFIRLISPSHYGKAVFLVKEIQFGVDQEVTPDLWRVEGFPDVFDPAFAKAALFFARGEEMFQDVSVLAQAPWVVGVTSDDRDYLFGFGSIRAFGGWHHHLGQIAMATRPTQAANPRVWRGAVRRHLHGHDGLHQARGPRLPAREVRTLDALNAAWGSSYTTWDSDGAPWPRGKGVLDESGRSRWMGKDFYSLTDAAPAVRATSTRSWGCSRTSTSPWSRAPSARCGPHHLVSSPGRALSARAHPEVLKAAGRHCDVLQIEGHGTPTTTSAACTTSPRSRSSCGPRSCPSAIPRSRASRAGTIPTTPPRRAGGRPTRPSSIGCSTSARPTAAIRRWASTGGHGRTRSRGAKATTSGWSRTSTTRTTAGRPFA